MMVNRLRNGTGVVLIIVIIIIFLMSIVSATIFSQSMSQSKTGRAQVNAIVAEQLAKGMYWKHYQYNYSPVTGLWGNFTSLCPADPDCNVTIDGQSYNTVVTPPALGANNLTVLVNYN